MKPLSSHQAREFWTYLHDQAEAYTKYYLNGGHDHAHKDEMRAARETYQWLLKEFSKHVAQSIIDTSDIRIGLTEDQANKFLQLLDKEIADMAARQALTQRQKQAALAGVRDLEYLRVRDIYKQMENREEQFEIAYKNSRERFVSIVQISVGSSPR